MFVSEGRAWASVRFAGALQGRQLVVKSLLVPAAAQCSTSANLKGAIWSRVEGRGGESTQAKYIKAKYNKDHMEYMGLNYDKNIANVLTDKLDTSVAGYIVEAISTL